jgi:hypothetical protein
MSLPSYELHIEQLLEQIKDSLQRIEKILENQKVGVDVSIDKAHRRKG